MNRPYISCHIMTSLDGKILGNYMDAPEGAADGSPTTQTLFMARDGLSDDAPVGFDLQEAKVMDGGSVWLRYLVKNREEN